MAKEKVLILGAGLAGLSAAWHLQKRGIAAQVFEKEPEAGGLCRSEKVGGFTFDCDGHLLHFRHRDIYDSVKNLLNGNLARHKRKSYIRYQDCEIPYPFQANFLKLPRHIAQECLNGLKTAFNHKKNYPNFKTWAYANFGKGITEHFMLPFNEKFWRVPAEELTCGWLDGFIPVLKLRELKAQPRKQVGYNAIFYYPAKGGIEELPLALAKNIKRDIHLNCRVTAIDIDNKEITINHKQRINYAKLISSLPLPEFKKMIKNLPCEIKRSLGLLNYNSILVFNLGIKAQIKNDRHWIYFPEDKFSYFRMGFYNSFSEALTPPGKSSLYVEVSYLKDKPADTGQLKDEIIKSLIEGKIINSPSDIVHCSILDIKYGYPIYDHNYQRTVPKVLEFLRRHNIYSIGRYGSWRYMSMEGALLEGRNIARHI